MAKRQQTAIPSVFPSYASVCSDFARYSSACSCLTGVVTTVATPTKTSSTTTTKSTTTTVSATATETAGAFYIRVTSGTLTGKYAYVPPYADGSPNSAFSRLRFGAVDTTAAALFYVDHDGILRPVIPIPQDAEQGGTVVAYYDNPDGNEVAWIWGKADSLSNDFSLLDCAIGGGN